MESKKTPFIIIDIRATVSSMDGFGLDIYLKDGLQLKSKFHNVDQYEAAVKAKGNLTKLKKIFREFINNYIKNSRTYYYFYSNCELFNGSFSEILQDPIEDQYPEAMDLIRSCAVEKNIEFDGYFQRRWEESADSIINFNEDYFDDPERTELYVHLSASEDDEIFEFLQMVYDKLFSIEITHETVFDRIKFLTKEKGVKF